MKTLLQWDRWIQTSVNLDMISPVNDKLMSLWSAEWPWFLIVLGFLIPIIRQKNWPRLWAFGWVGLTIGLCDMLSHYLLKPWFGRIRPCRFEGLVRVVEGCSGYYSFPSNHAANAAVFATLWFLLFSRFQGMLAMLCALVIGMSRVYLGVHYPTDILGGFVWGTALALLSYLIWQRLPVSRETVKA
ncbi:phosphatase PAP2 family protein [Oligoflexus tunisiensis]|uniref:phosphatase PAP2 family protein n=1 Tax=Oligoflexus tunisiensis TaxID=708132 RepID=UPI00114D1DFF|nr:phosphatase PAP2 family protein [Oligoflexus tunisiensis]